MRKTLSIRRNHSMGAGSSGNRPTIEKPIAKTRTLTTITANITGTPAAFTFSRFADVS